LHTLDTIDLDINYNTSYSLASYRNSELASDLWFTDLTIVATRNPSYNLPFVQSINPEMGKVRSKSDYYLWVEAIFGFRTYSPDCVMPIYNFTSNGHRFASYEAVGEFRVQVINAINSGDHSSSLMFLSEKIKNGEMPDHPLCEFFDRDEFYSIFEIENPLSTAYEVGINVSFTEEELRQIKGFKLIK
jgi:hypothetical protein